MHQSRRALLIGGLQLVAGFTLASCTSSVPAAPATSAPATSKPVAPATTAPAAPAATSATAAAPTTAPTVAAAGAVPSAPTTAAAVVGKPGGTLTYADWGDATSMDPAFITNQVGRRPGKALYDSLVDVDPSGTIVPVLAESWDVPDTRTYVLHLKQGVKFHDGTTFDAEAVKFNIDRHLDPKTASKRNAELGIVDGVDVIDANTVKFRLKTPSAAFLQLLYDWNGFIVSPTALQRWGNDDYGVHPVGAGPFRFVSHQDADRTVLERNPDYWMKDRPLLDQIVFKPVLNDATREIEVRSGSSQIGDAMPFQDVDNLKGMSEINLVQVPGAKFYYTSFQPFQTPYGESLEFRQALNWLIDREAIFNSVFFKTGSVGYDPFIPGSPFNDPAYKPFTRDLDKAKALLDKSGVPSPGSFVIYADTEPVSQKLVQIVQANYADIGVNVEIQNEVGAAAQARTDRGDWVLSLNSQSWWGYRPDPSQYLAAIFRSDTQYHKWTLNDPDIDRFIDSGIAETDVAKRKQIYRSLADRLNEIVPAVFFAYGVDIKALSPRVKGFLPHPDQVTRFRDMSLD
jgi:peptide/nickel transport system substrate-binding protein